MNLTLKKSPLIVAFVGIALLAATLACNPMSALNQNAAPTPTLFVAPSTTGGGASGGEGALAFASADSAGLSSFRSVFTLSYNGVDGTGAPLVGTLTFNQAHTANPPAQQLTWGGEGNVGDPNMRDFEIVQISGQTYSVTKDPSGTPVCITMSAGNNPPGQSPDQFLSNADLSKARRILPDETVNGVLSQHWQFTKAEVTLIGGNWDSYTVDVWMAVDGGYTTKATFSGDGSDLTFKGGSGHVDWTYDVTEVNTVAPIQPPAGCGESAGAAFPQMPDAADVITFGENVSYTTLSPVADVVAFYSAQLPGLGWTPGEVTNPAPELATMKFTKDGKTATISISSADGKTTIIVAIQ